MTRYAIYIAVLIAVLLFAFWRGGKDERYSALVVVMMGGLDQVYHAAFGILEYDRFLDIGHFSIDLFAFLAFTWIVLIGNRIWTIWLASAQLIALLSHLLRLMDWTMNPLVYAILMRAPSYIIIVLVAWGTWNYHRRQVKKKQIS